ncbi:MAG: DUF1059 domain-containing protein [Actinobacteria bacterium]|nr:DUF1059 domain-containing protein [Actinomycetota bacterium]
MGHACRWQGKAATEDELMTLISDHVRRVHKVETTTGTIASYVKQKIRRL